MKIEHYKLLTYISEKIGVEVEILDGIDFRWMLPSNDGLLIYRTKEDYLVVFNNGYSSEAVFRRYLPDLLSLACTKIHQNHIIYKATEILEELEKQC